MSDPKKIIFQDGMNRARALGRLKFFDESKIKREGDGKFAPKDGGGSGGGDGPLDNIDVGNKAKPGRASGERGKRAREGAGRLREDVRAYEEREGGGGRSGGVGGSVPVDLNKPTPEGDAAAERLREERERIRNAPKNEWNPAAEAQGGENNRVPLSADDFSGPVSEVSADDIPEKSRELIRAAVRAAYGDYEKAAEALRGFTDPTKKSKGALADARGWVLATLNAD